jgi:hypothetical protein
LPAFSLFGAERSEIFFGLEFTAAIEQLVLMRGEDRRVKS